MPAAQQPAIYWITHEFSPFRGGAGVYVREIARAAAKLGIPSAVVTADYDGRLSAAERAQMHATDAEEPFLVARLKCTGRLSPGGILRFAAGLFRQRRRWQQSPVVLLSAGAQMSAFLLQAARQFPAGQTICFFHGSEVLRFARHPIWRLLARRFYARSAGFAVASQYVRELALQSGLLPPGAPICIAPCGVPSAYVRMGIEKLDTTGKDEPIVVLTVGRLHPRKGQVQVAQALAILPPDLRRRLIYRLVGVGDPSYRHEIGAVCGAAGIQSEFLGGIAEAALAAVFSRCDIYAQASQTLPQSVEGFGISLLEAAFFGCPVAAFRSGGVTEAVAEGTNAILVDEGDVEGLSAAIAELISDPVRRLQFSQAGQAYARRFSWEDSARSLSDFAWQAAQR